MQGGSAASQACHVNLFVKAALGGRQQLTRSALKRKVENTAPLPSHSSLSISLSISPWLSLCSVFLSISPWLSLCSVSLFISPWLSLCSVFYPNLNHNRLSLSLSLSLSLPLSP